jgi:succinyl-diaminopimelate desuccinylase
VLTDQEKEVIALIDDRELIRWVRELTRIPSVWRPQQGVGEEKAARWVETRCQEIGLDTHFELVRPGRPNVIATHGNGDGPTLMFEGHTDVVTEGDPALWTDPPFSATIREERIYGRGANDMKAGLVCALIATKALAQSGIQLNGNILIGAVCDEEGEMLGIKSFVENGWADDVDAAIICEPEENSLCICQKGVMWVKVRAEGIMSHGAMPLTGVNSAYPLARFLGLVEELEKQLISNLGRNELLGQPSITPTILHSPLSGESQKNVMPGAAETILDIRLIPGQDPDQLVRELKGCLDQALNGDDRLSGRLEILELRHPTETDRNHRVVTSLASAYESLTGLEPVFGGVPGSTDGTILHALKGIPIVTCGPGDKHIPHHIDEWVSIAEIKQAARMYVLAAMRYLGVRND